MLPYNQPQVDELNIGGKAISSFIKSDEANLDKKTVQSFGDEWSKFDKFEQEDIQSSGDEYFDIVGDNHINKSTMALDVGCGTGRWSRFIAERVGFLEAVDPSMALVSAVNYNKDKENIRFTHASVSNIPFENDSFDFAMCLGVLHHIPDTAEGVKKIFEKIKPNGFFLLYLYYSLDSRGILYKTLFKASNSIRWVVSKLPQALKMVVCDLIALFVYLPLVTFSRIVKYLGGTEIYNKLPLAYYENKNFTIMRNDSLDRFGTPLEQRFSKIEINKMIEDAGFVDITFSDGHLIGM
jgi:ubiquinone/menaquinone biosynthesis C-methylase UbiE